MSKGNVLDTLIIEDSKIVFKDLHLARTQETFRYLNINADQDIENCYNAIETLYADKAQNNECLRIIFLQTLPLSYKVEIKRKQQLSTAIKLNLVKLKNQIGPEAAFKWENREHWNLLFKDKSNEADDILVVNTKSDIVETSRFNIFCYDELSNMIFTPPLESGCLNGVFRRFVLNQGFINLASLGNKQLVEKNIKFDELNRYQLYVGNSVRGALNAHLLQ